ncbi:G patch domain-containing protein 1 homolog [Chelonus insularis]|uniref:G patch domain-containing protein 1 homolog n=1 Tax=Chelonus insularis TaxID=460826 RepID=UPI00158A435E|nr:G patch domain-containing protein 1 homolog [Chelonus insularis]
MGDSDDECFVTYGEPLEPLDEDNLPRKKAQTIEDQYALDDQGRRRFHGAFTGGFSAGYFNSVDTRDGWRPQQFKSSRSSKAGSISQRPEDFMDEEDTGEFGIAPSGIRATSDFADQNKNEKKRRRGQSYNQEPIPGVPVLKELLKPVTDTVGVTLLKRMGWKPGQGIGLRLTKREKKRIREKNAKKKVYGCSLPGQEFVTSKSDSENSDDEQEDDNGQAILFAPDDYEPFRCNPKDNYFGLGYSGLDRRPVLSGHVNLFDTPAFQLQEKNKKLSIRGQAFGVGAFEADDEDIYAVDDMSRYDFTLGPEVKKKNRWSKEEKAACSQSKCIPGFVPGKNNLERKKPYEPPVLPKDFKPIHLTRKSRFDCPDESTSNINQQKLSRPQLNAEERGIILGESTRTPLTGSKQEISVMGQKIQTKSSTASNIITRTLNLNGREQQEMRTQLKDQKFETSKTWLDKLNLTNFVCGGVEGTNPNSSGSLKQLKDFQSTCSLVETKVRTNEENKEDCDDLEFIKSFTTDVDKQKRFLKYFDILKNGGEDKLKSLGSLKVTEWEQNHEHEEFEEAVRLFEKKNASESLSKFAKETTSNSCLSSSVEPAVSAAKMNMFGKLTRTVDTWQPASIVCKRFNIPEPKSGCMQPKLQKNKKYSVFESLDILGDGNKFQKAVETAGSYKEPYIPYKIADKSVRSDDSDVKNSEEASNHLNSDVNSTKSSKSTENFKASYEKVFGMNNLNETGVPAINLKSSFESLNDKKSNKEKEDMETGEISSVIQSKENTEEKKDLFKAIFLSSSDESESENETNEDVDSNTVKSLLIGKPVGELNVQRNTSPPRGIFAKLDLDDILVPGKITEKSNENLIQLQDKQKGTTEKLAVAHLNKSIPDEKPTQTVETEALNEASNTADADAEVLPDVYGPVLPSKPSTHNNSNDSTDIQKPIFKSVVVPKLNNPEIMKWVEKSKAKKSKKEKKKHKHKQKEKKKHKSKRKH